MREVVMERDVAQGTEPARKEERPTEGDLTTSNGRRPAPSPELALTVRSTGDRDLDALLAPETMPGGAESVRSGGRDRFAARTAERVAREVPRALDEAARTAEDRVQRGADSVSSVTSSRPGATLGEVTDEAIAVARRAVPAGLSADKVMTVDAEIALRVHGIAAQAEKRIEAAQARAEERADVADQKNPQPTSQRQPIGAAQPAPEAQPVSQSDAMSALGIGVKMGQRVKDGAGISQEQATADRAAAAKGARQAEADRKQALLVNGKDPLAELEKRREGNRLGTSVIRGMFGSGLPSVNEAGIPPAGFVRQELLRPVAVQSTREQQQKRRVAA